MKTQATYQGTTKAELEARILNIENTLMCNDLEAWESKEYREVIQEYKRQISTINENQMILDSIY